MKKYSLRFISLILIGVFVFAGCSVSRLGEALFACNMNNIWGLQGVYFDSNNSLTFKFDPNHDSSNSHGIGFDNVFNNGSFSEFDQIILMTENNESFVSDMDKVTIDSKNGIISFTVNDFDVNEIKTIQIDNDLQVFYLDLEEKSLEAAIYDENQLTLTQYTQKFDEEKNEWSRLEYITN